MNVDVTSATIPERHSGALILAQANITAIRYDIVASCV
jgi:hypothetical protein